MPSVYSGVEQQNFKYCCSYLHGILSQTEISGFLIPFKVCGRHLRVLWSLKQSVNRTKKSAKYGKKVNLQCVLLLNTQWISAQKVVDGG